MKIQGFKRLIKENVTEDFRDVIDTVGASVNVFAEDVLNAMNKNLSVDDNLKMEYKTIDITLGANGLPLNDAQLTTKLFGKIQGISVERAENLTNSATYPSGAPFVTFSQNNTLITLNHITGLQANNKYRLTLLLKG